LVWLSTQILVEEGGGVTATATPPATTSPMTNPAITFEKVDAFFMTATLAFLPENSFNKN
jgi:hypothetical protein